MTIYRNLTAEDVAAQYQMLTDLMLSAICMGNPETREKCAKSIDKMIAGFQENGMDTTILQLSAAGLRLQHAEE